MAIGFFDNIGRSIRRKRIEWLGSVKNAGKLFIFLLLLLLCVVLWQKYSDAVGAYFYDSAKRVSISLGMELKEVSIEGVQNMPTDSLHSFIESEIEGQSLVFLDIELLRMKIENLSWVKEVSIQRLFPDRLFIRIKEHVPQARWQVQGKHYMITEQGEVVSDKVPEKFANLTLLVGENANFHVPDLRELLSHGTALSDRVIAASWIGDRRWDIYFSNGIIVKLPQDNADEAWSKLQKLAIDELLLEHKNIAIIDMRVSDRLVLRFKDNSESAYGNDEGA